MEAGAGSFSSATGVLGLRAETVCREASSVSDSRCGEGDLVFESEEVVSAGRGSALESSGDAGGGVGCPLSSKGTEF